jgi:two-component system chemotaxis sensor kinase CheA
VDSREFLDLFLSEAREHLDGMSALLARARQQGLGPEEINDLFRHAHSLKGMAATLGFRPVTALAHAMEDLLHAWRGGGRSPASGTLDLLARATDRLSAQIESIAGGGAPGMEGELTAALRAAAPAPPRDAPSAATAPPAEVPPTGSAPADEPDARPRLRVEINLKAGTPLPAARALVILKRLRDHGRILECTPAPDAMASPGFTGRLNVLLATSVSAGRLEDLVASLPDVDDCAAAEVRGDPGPGHAEPAAPGSGAGAPGHATAGETGPPRGEGIATIRVATERMDRLLDGIGELILDRERLRRALDPDPRSEAGEVLESLGRTVSLLRDEVMEMRLIPFAALAPRLQRAVRDLARRLGKEVELEVRGTDIAIDRSILEEMMDPLEHLLRNSIDHGIEDAAARRAAGKPPSGRIEIVLSRREDRVCLQASDDGRGIDPGALRRVALEKHFISRDAAERLSDEDALMLVTLPGFSTAARTTDISGRGVGMDVVRTRVQRLGGSLLIRSRPGSGTTFEMDLPPTVTVTRAFLCRASGEVYAVPVSTVQATLQVRSEGLLGSQGDRVLRRDDDVITILPLGGLLAGDAAPPFPRAFPALVYRVGARSYALAVDEILGEEEIVVKPLRHPLELLPHYAGAAILNDGRIALILDPANLTRALRAA